MRKLKLNVESLRVLTQPVRQSRGALSATVGPSTPWSECWSGCVCPFPTADC